MRIQWSIDKKRGNFRPTLTYTITLEPFEKELAVNALTVKSLIPRIPHARRPFCLPGEDERTGAWVPERYHYLCIPSAPYLKDNEIKNVIRLPFREEGEYPEVEDSFEVLRHAYEKIVKQAYGHGPISRQGDMEMTPETKRTIAAKIARAKLLNVYGTDRMSA